MPEALTEKNWNAIKKAAGVELDDDALVKALRRFDKVDAAKPVAWKSALADVTGQLEALEVVVTRQRRTLGKGATEIQAKLAAMGATAADLLKTGPVAAGAGEEDDADAPALLSSKMKPLLKELMQGGVTMHALICTVGKSTVALVMRKEIGPQRRSFLAGCAAEKGTPKFIPATCSLEGAAITFVVQEGGKGLARRVSQALKDQTDTKWKVRVRGPDGDDDDEEDGAGPGAPEAAAAPPQAAADDPLARMRAWHDELQRSVDALAEPGDPANAADLARLSRGLAFLDKAPATSDMAKVGLLVDSLRDVVAAIRARMDEAARVAEAARLAEEARLAEAARVAEEARLAEEARRAEEARLAEEARRAEEARLAGEARLAEAARVEEARRVRVQEIVAQIQQLAGQLDPTADAVNVGKIQEVARRLAPPAQPTIATAEQFLSAVQRTVDTTLGQRELAAAEARRVAEAEAAAAEARRVAEAEAAAAEARRIAEAEAAAAEARRVAEAAAAAAAAEARRVAEAEAAAAEARRVAEAEEAAAAEARRVAEAEAAAAEARRIAEAEAAAAEAAAAMATPTPAAAADTTATVPPAAGAATDPAHRAEVESRVDTLRLDDTRKAQVRGLVATRPAVAEALTDALAAMDAAETALGTAAGDLAAAKSALANANERQTAALERNTTAYAAYQAAAGNAAEQQRLAPDVRDSKRDYDAAVADIAAAEERLQAARKAQALQRRKELLLGAVTVGTASRTGADPAAVAGLSEAERLQRQQQAAQREAATAAVLKQAGAYPELAFDALDVLAQAEHPEALVQGLDKLGALAASSFGGRAGSPAEARKMARTALEMAAKVGGDYLVRLDAYHATPAAAQPDPNRSTAASKADRTAQTTRKVSQALGSAVLDAEGRLAPNGAAAQALRDRLLFHPDSLKEPLPVLAGHVEQLCKTLADPAQSAAFQATLDRVRAPSAGTAAGLVRRTAMTGAGAPAAGDAKAAVLGAMMTPLTQGAVGSCFATCACMEVQERRPLELMGDLCQIAQGGTLAKGGLDAVPAVVNIPDGENPLLRSWEYSVATLGARAAHSAMKTGVENDTNAGLVQVDTAARGLLQRMDASIARAAADRDAKYAVYDAAYDAAAAATTPADRAEKARIRDAAQAEWEAARDAHDQKIRDFPATVERLQQAAADAMSFSYDPTMTRGRTAADGSSTKGGWTAKARTDDGEEQPITDWDGYQACVKAAFVSVLGADADEATIDSVIGSQPFYDAVTGAHAGKGTPWRQEKGGTATDIQKVLEPGHEQRERVYDAAADPAATRDTRTQRLLAGLVDATKGASTDTLMLDVPNHAERALPKHPSLDALKVGGDVAGAVTRTFEQAREKVTRPMDDAQAQYLLAKAAESFMLELLDGDLGALDLPGAMPPGQSPAQFKAKVLEQVGPRITELAAVRYRDPAAGAAHLTTQLGAGLDSLLAGELHPAFVIADTNWGDGSEKFVQVVAPDPVTGEARLWQKSTTTGKMTPMDDDWVADGWSVQKETA